MAFNELEEFIENNDKLEEDLMKEAGLKYNSSLSRAKSPIGAQTKNKNTKSSKLILEEQERDEANQVVDQSNKKRILWGGGQYQRPKDMSKGDELTSTNYEYLWHRNHKKTSTRDFLTLLRKTACAVLANQGFIIREIFVNKGEQIGLILTMPEENLARIAAILSIPRPVEFGVADLLSLEPIDSRDRPLRLNLALWDESLWGRFYEANLKDPNEREFRDNLRIFIVDMLNNQCNMKKIVRMCGGVWSEDYKMDSMRSIVDMDVLPLQAWKDYAEYLVMLSYRVKEIQRIKKKITGLIKAHYTYSKVIGKGGVDRQERDMQEVQKFTTRELVRAFEICIDECSKPPMKMTNLWKKSNIQVPPEYYSGYELGNSKMKPRRRMFYNSIWKDHYSYFDISTLDEPQTSTSPDKNGNNDLK